MVYKATGKYGGQDKHPLLSFLAKLQGPTSQSQSQSQSEFESAPKPDQGNPEAKGVSETQEIAELRKKREKCCDEVFAEYLNNVAANVNPHCYAETLIHVLLYRECLNHYAHKLHDDSKNLPSTLVRRGLGSVPSEEQDDSKAGEYCVESNAEQTPDISNEFMVSFFPQHDVGLTRERALQLTLRLCNWLFSNGYTCSLVSLKEIRP